MNKFSNHTELRTVQDLIGIPPGRYVVTGEAAKEVIRQDLAMKVVLYGRPGYGRSYAYSWQIEKDWQWPERWHGTLCLLSEREDVREAQ